MRSLCQDSRRGQQLVNASRIRWAPHLSFSQIFTVVAIPGVISAVALMVKYAVYPEQKTAGTKMEAEVLAH